SHELRCAEPYGSAARQARRSNVDAATIIVSERKLRAGEAMRRFQRREHIAASNHRVWAILTDVERWPEWTAWVTRIEKLDSQPLGLGSRVRIHQPKLRPAVWVVTAWEPESNFVWEAKVPGITSIGSHVLEPCEQGCEVTLNLRFDGWLSGLAGFL